MGDMHGYTTNQTELLRSSRAAHTCRRKDVDGRLGLCAGRVDPKERVRPPHTLA